MAKDELTPLNFDPKKSGIKLTILHFSGDRKSATTDEGRTVRRQDKLFVPEYGHYVPCMPYITHFIFEEKREGFNAYQCSCGFPAVIVGHQQYKDDMSATPTGEMFVCLHHAQTGVHRDGSKM